VTNENPADYREDVLESLERIIGIRNPFLTKEDLKFTARLIETPENVDEYARIYDHFEEEAGLQGKIPPDPDTAGEKTELELAHVYAQANLYWVIHHTKTELPFQYR
jgi:hypothetical protein